jgi:hypothetical protein
VHEKQPSAEPVRSCQLLVDGGQTSGDVSRRPLGAVRLERWAPGAEAFLVSIGNVTSYRDTNVKRGTTYYYKVTAVNAAGESPLSNEASATAP